MNDIRFYIFPYSRRPLSTGELLEMEDVVRINAVAECLLSEKSAGG